MLLDYFLSKKIPLTIILQKITEQKISKMKGIYTCQSF